MPDFLAAYPLPVLLFAAASFLMAFIAWTDFKSFTVPDVPVILIAALGLITRYWQHSDLLMVVAVAAAVGAVMFVLAKIFEFISMQTVLGYGDMKLLAAASIWLKMSQLPLFFIFTGALGLLLALLFMKNKYFPLAPAIAIAWFVSLIR